MSDHKQSYKDQDHFNCERVREFRDRLTRRSSNSARIKEGVMNREQY